MLLLSIDLFLFVFDLCSFFLKIKKILTWLILKAFDVRHVRVIAPEHGDNAYMALFRFSTQKAADQVSQPTSSCSFVSNNSFLKKKIQLKSKKKWRESVHGRPFEAADGPRISVIYVARVSLVRRGARLFPHEGALELPKCPVCLDYYFSNIKKKKKEKKRKSIF